MNKINVHDIAAKQLEHNYDTCICNRDFAKQICDELDIPYGDYGTDFDFVKLTEYLGEVGIKLFISKFAKGGYLVNTKLPPFKYEPQIKVDDSWQPPIWWRP